MKNFKKFERKCMKLHEDFQNSFLHARSFDRRFEIFNSYIDNFTKLALKIKPHVSPENSFKYKRRVEFFINDCQNEMKIYLTLGIASYQKCNSKKESLKLFRQRLSLIAEKMKVPDFYGTIMVVPSKTLKFKIITLRHAFNSDKMQNINGVLVPYYSTIFDSNLSDVLEYWLNIRVHDILITSTLA